MLALYADGNLVHDILSAHLEISLLKFKALTLGVDGQPAQVHSFGLWC
jgi:hypothetical protein